MKTDLYLKTVLTVIAFCLLWLVAKPFIVTTAEAGPQVLQVDIVRVAGSPIYDAVPVK